MHGHVTCDKHAANGSIVVDVDIVIGIVLHQIPASVLEQTLFGVVEMMTTRSLVS